MKRISSIFILSLLLSLTLLGQNYRVTNIQGAESLDPPVLDIQGSTARIIHNTNFWFYNFPVTGPSAPIPTSSAVHPRDIGWGPLNSVMRGNGNTVVLAYTMFESFSGNEGYRTEYVTSADGGATWSTYDMLDKLTTGYSSISLYYDNVILEKSDNGYYYYLWRNQQDTNRIYMSISTNGGAIFAPKTLVPVGDTLRAAAGLSLKTLTLAGTDNLFLSYSTDTTLYLIRSSDGGSSFGAPKKILNVKAGGRISRTKLLGSADGTMYLSYSYWNMHMGMPPVFDEGTVLLKSTNYGANWSVADTIHASEYSIYDLQLTSTKTLVDVDYEFPNLYVRSSLNGTLWSDTVRVNPTLNTVTGKYNFGISSALVDDSNIGVAWIDTSTGNDEIFYREMTIPSSPAAGITGRAESSPFGFILSQNYPNPFNPTTTIRFSVEKNGRAVVKVFDLLGRRVAMLYDNVANAGQNYTVTLDGTRLSSGMYFYSIESNNQRIVKKMLMLK